MIRGEKMIKQISTNRLTGELLIYDKKLYSDVSDVLFDSLQLVNDIGKTEENIADKLMEVSNVINQGKDFYKSFYPSKHGEYMKMYLSPDSNLLVAAIRTLVRLSYDSRGQDYNSLNIIINYKSKNVFAATCKVSLNYEDYKSVAVYNYSIYNSKEWLDLIKKTWIENFSRDA